MNSKKKATKRVPSRLPGQKNPKTWDEVEAGPSGPPPPEKTHVKRSKDFEKFPPPSKQPVFVAKWSEFIEDVVNRENFKKGHLEQLRLLCDLYVDYEDLCSAIRTHGLTYKAVGRAGVQIKMRPEVLQKNRVIAEIRNYSKMLGLLLFKDKDASGAEAEAAENWE